LRSLAEIGLRDEPFGEVVESGDATSGDECKPDFEDRFVPRRAKWE
jgi:hypothetical protein